MASPYSHKIINNKSAVVGGVITNGVCMDRIDVDTFIKAKKEDLVYRIFHVCVILLIGLLLYLNRYYPGHAYTTIILGASLLFSGLAQGMNRWVSVSRQDLLEIIQRMINRDSDAIEKISKSKL